MNKQQIEHSKQCNQVSENGYDRDCFYCSCHVCLAKSNNTESGLIRAIEIIKKEMEIAKEINPTMAFGMLQVKGQIEIELEELQIQHIYIKVK